MCELIKKRWVHLLAEGVSAWTGGVEGMNEGKKKDLRDRSVWRGERCVGRFSQLPTLLWILRFKGLVFFLALKGKHEKKIKITRLRDGTVFTLKNEFIEETSCWSFRLYIQSNTSQSCEKVHCRGSVSAQTPHSKWQAQWWRGDDLGLFCSHRTWELCSYGVRHELLCILKYSDVKCDAICRTAKAWLK